GGSGGPRRGQLLKVVVLEALRVGGRSRVLRVDGGEITSGVPVVPLGELFGERTGRRLALRLDLDAPGPVGVGVLVGGQAYPLAAGTEDHPGEIAPWLEGAGGDVRIETGGGELVPVAVVGVLDGLRGQTADRGIRDRGRRPVHV